MTPKKMLEVLDVYHHLLVGHGHTPERVDLEGDEIFSLPMKMNHILFACEEATRIVKSGRVEKAMRWLGFIQGFFWATDLRKLTAMKNDNRDESDKVPAGSR